MANKELSNKYFVKKTAQGTYEDITSKFDGVKILSVDGMLSKGKAVNIYTAQWINEQTEDFMVTTQVEVGGEMVDKVVYENVDIEVTFIVGDRYTKSIIDIRKTHDAFIDYMTSGDLYLRSLYVGLDVHCVCLEAYKPTTIHLQRGAGNNWIIGTIKLHTLDKTY